MWPVVGPTFQSMVHGSSGSRTIMTMDHDYVCTHWGPSYVHSMLPEGSLKYVSLRECEIRVQKCFHRSCIAIVRYSQLTPTHDGQSPMMVPCPSPMMTRTHYGPSCVHNMLPKGPRKCVSQNACKIRVENYLQNVCTNLCLVCCCTEVIFDAYFTSIL